MSKPTEGPYKIDNYSPHCILRGNTDKTHIWRIASVNKRFPNWQANARLLAKSWEMREILKEAVEAKTPEGALWLVGWRWEEARALLAEIDGEDQ